MLVKMERMPATFQMVKNCPRCSSPKIYSTAKEFICMTCSFMVIEEDE